MNRMRWVNRRRIRLAVAGLCLAGGCRDSGAVNVEVAPAPKSPTEKTVPTVSIRSPETPAETSAQPAASDRLHQPFRQACTTEVTADSGVALPPVYTLAGKNTGSLNEAVQQIWDQIRFVDEQGKPQTFLLELEVGIGDRTLGTIEILTQPEWAPNHVRNFVALTKVGYYDGLRFDRVVRQSVEGVGGGELLLVEAGSPVESAEPSVSHLGYWLLPEFHSEVKHEIGIVGACLIPSEDNAETACCRFYIALSNAPAMDGNFTVFGRVSKGLEIVRQISEQPILSNEPGPDQGRLAVPIVIRKAVARPIPVVK
jgi:cyclophilin family peptidyl-prolyl cis-trans isomerase